MTLGELAQLVEHLLCKQGVIGSNPLFSTYGDGFMLSPDSLEIFDMLEQGSPKLQASPRFARTDDL